MDDIRETQARNLFQLGWGAIIGFARFDDYLASIPEVPSWSEDKRFDRIVLVDVRIPLSEACRCAGLHSFQHDPRFEEPARAHMPAVYWMRCQDGRRYRGLKLGEVRYRRDERGMMAAEGVALYAQDPRVLIQHNIDLPGSSVRWIRLRGHNIDIAKLKCEKYSQQPAGLYLCRAGVGPRESTGVGTCIVLSGSEMA